MKIKGKIAAVLMAAAVGITALPVTSFAESLSTDSVTVEYGAAVAKPSYLIKGTKGQRKIKLTCSTSGATIYYTTNGKTPTTSSKKYNGGLIVTKKGATIKAIAVKNGSKSAVMTKKIDVTTLKGDVTGNGKVDKTDYARFIKYRDGETTYVCKDNCDMNGDGKVTTKDITLLYNKVYGDDSAEYEEDDSSNVSSSIKQPVMTVYRVYGGKSVKLECDTDGAVIYYTTDGTKPDKGDYKYTTKFVLEDDATVKAVAYKGGKYSTVKTRTVTVDTCAAPTADKSTDIEYSESVTVRLSGTTPSSRICYTLDGTDPVKYGRIYTDPIILTENTTLKIYSEAKGYANSRVVTYQYRVKSSNYTISGRVWDDSMVSTPNGIYQSGEAGINGITVMLLNTKTNKYEQTVQTSTINGVAGSYELTKCKPGSSYKVVFQFNGQKYRAYTAVIAGGNQAVSSAFPAITIKGGGAYSQANVLMTNVNSYANAVVSAYYNGTYATTNNTYTSPAQNVNLALQSDVYGELNLAFGTTNVTSASTGRTNIVSDNQKVYSNDVITYQFTLSNKSENQILNSSDVVVFIPEALDVIDIDSTDTNVIEWKYEGVHKTFGLDTYVLKSPKLGVDCEVTFVITAKVRAGVANNTAIAAYAQVGSYAFSGSCYDKYSVPNNFTGTVRERDEAMSVRLIGYTDATASQSISWTAGNNYSAIPLKTSRVLKFSIANGTSLNDFSVYVSDKNVVSYVPTFVSTATGIDCMLVLTGENEGTTNVVITLKKDATKYIDTNISVSK